MDGAYHVNSRGIVAVIGVIVVAVATVLGIDLPKDEVAGAITDLAAAAAGVIGILAVAWRGRAQAERAADGDPG